MEKQKFEEMIDLVKEYEMLNETKKNLVHAQRNIETDNWRVSLEMSCETRRTSIPESLKRKVIRFMIQEVDKEIEEILSKC